MEILVIKSSPHMHGSSNLLADSFIRGAEESGHRITVFDAGHCDMNPCRGCDACIGNGGRCVQKDDMAELSDLILGTDMVVFVTPLYYFGVSAQLKMVIDRFYAINGRIQSKGLRSALIVAAWDSNDWTMTDIQSHYRTLCRYLNMEDMGSVLGTGCGNVGMTERSGFPERAYSLGKSL